MTKWTVALVVTAVVLILLVGSLLAARLLDGSEDASAPETFNGGMLSPAPQLPDFTLRRADGQHWSTAETSGRLSLFSFGYTSCPDVCPLTLHQLAEARRQLGERASALDVYFVTVDPERDTPERLAIYTANYDKAIVGLTGTDEELERARNAFGVVAEKRPAEGDPAQYSVDHTATTYLVDGSGQITLLYAYGTPAQDIVSDVHRLLADGADEPMSAMPAGESQPAGSAVAVDGINAEGQWARAAMKAGQGAVGNSAVFVTLRNQGVVDDRLIGASADVADAVEVHRSYRDGDMMRMEKVDGIGLPVGESVSLQPGGYHVMLIGLRQDLVEGSQLTVTLHFERATDLVLDVPVRSAGGMSTPGGMPAHGR